MTTNFREVNMFKTFLLLIFSVTILTLPAAAQFTIAGEVIDVIDGKTVLVAIPGGKVKVELQYIDVPEQGQQLSDTVKEHLRSLTAGKSVEYRPKTLLHDRAIGRVTVKNIDVSQQMLRDGAAWLMPQGSSGQQKSEHDLYASTEAAAKNDKIGVWSIPGLKPAWEFRADGQAANQRKQDLFGARTSSTNTVKIRSRPTVISNPAFGDVGALFSRYDPVTRTGLLSTLLLPINTEKSASGADSIALDVTYYYKENEQKKRTGSFVFTAVFQSSKPLFNSSSNLVLLDNDRKTVIAKPRRKVSYEGDYVRETMVCEISRPMLERVAMNDSVTLKMGEHLIQLTGGRYLVYNLLQVTQ